MRDDGGVQSFLVQGGAPPHALHVAAEVLEKVKSDGNTASVFDVYVSVRAQEVHVRAAGVS